MAMGGGGGSGNDAGADEARRQARISEGRKKVGQVFSRFTPEYYNQRTRAYNEYATPQLEDQFTEAGDKLKFALARQFGTTQTSVAAKKQAELGKKYALARTNLAETGLQEAKQAEGDVEQQRASVLQMLNSTADPASASNIALAQANVLQKPSLFTPLADVFGDVTAGLATQYGPTGGVAGQSSSPPSWTYNPRTNQYERGGSARVVT